MVAKLLTFALQMVGVLWMFIAGGWGVYRYERLEPGWPNYKVGFLFIHVTLHAPGAGSVTALSGKLDALLADEAKAAKHNTQVVQAQGAVTTKAQTDAVASRVQIEWRTRTLIQQVPNVLTPDVDRRYPLPVGLWRTYNASVTGNDLPAVPDPTGRADDAPSGIAASTAGQIFASNNGEHRVCIDRLSRLQQWIRDEEAVK